MKFVVAPDSYKGSLSAAKVGSIMEAAIRSVLPDADIRVIPMADGGEGTVDALVAATDGERIAVQATGPLGKPVDTVFGLLKRDDTPIAVMEAANIFGLPMLAEGQRNPYRTTSRGLGDVLRAALDQGYRRIVIGLGGSSTNDGGIGMLTALGVTFTDAEGCKLEGYGADLERIAAVSRDGLDPRLAECDITVASDVDNPLCGLRGASHVFGPQKGATPEQVERLDSAMQAYAALLEREWGTQASLRSGAGAAGGLGFALMMLGAAIVPGAQVVEQSTGLGEHMAGADWVFTGEGRSDSQTLFGKLPVHVARLAKRSGAKAVLISGSLGADAGELNREFVACFSAVQRPASLQQCMDPDEAEANLSSCVTGVVRVIAASNRV
jgi:glycerate kinase